MPAAAINRTLVAKHKIHRTKEKQKRDQVFKMKRFFEHQHGKKSKHHQCYYFLNNF